MREWQDVEFNGAEDLARHLRREDGVIRVDHCSLLAAMTRTERDGWMAIASPVPSRPYLWFSHRASRLIGRVEDDRGFNWAAHVFDSDDATELATLSVYLHDGLLPSAMAA